ncbi:hypothetical protein, partial [Rhodoblastus sp.]|uniref:hypothetical protein n=1 Tax=Rhodoblastus sp. TaxID=1962975 RepID=UPI003F9713F4
IRIPNESFGIRIPLARKSARDIEDFRAMAFPRIAKQSCGNRMRRWDTKFKGIASWLKWIGRSIFRVCESGAQSKCRFLDFF